MFFGAVMSSFPSHLLLEGSFLLWIPNCKGCLADLAFPIAFLNRGYRALIFGILIIHIHGVFSHELSDSLIFMWLPWSVKSKKNVPALSSAEDSLHWGGIAPSQRWDLV